MLKKLGYVALILGSVIVAYIFITAGYDAILSMVDVAASDPSAGNYTEYEAVVNAAPLWLWLTRQYQPRQRFPG